MSLLPSTITRVREGDFMSATHYNQLVDICEALVRGQGRCGISFFPASAGMVWRGSGSGSSSSGGGTSTTGSAVSFRGEWDYTTTYDEGDVVFVHGTSDQALLSANTYVSKKDDNLNNKPPATTISVENEWWKVVSIGSWPSFVVANPNVAPVNERIVSLTPGSAQFTYSGSVSTGDDITTIVGGVVKIGGSLLVTGPVVVKFSDDTEVTIDVNDMDQVGSELNGRVFKLREMPYCDNGITRKIGVLCTEPFD